MTIRRIRKALPKGPTTRHDMAPRRNATGRAHERAHMQSTTERAPDRARHGAAMPQKACARSKRMASWIIRGTLQRQTSTVARSPSLHVIHKSDHDISNNIVSHQFHEPYMSVNSCRPPLRPQNVVPHFSRSGVLRPFRDNAEAYALGFEV